MPGAMRAMYAAILRLADRRDAVLWLVALSFAESSFLPVPPDPLLLAMGLARPSRAWRLAAICTLASVLGGLFGYAIGYAAFDAVGLPLLRLFHYEAGFDRFRALIGAYGFWIIMAKGLTPIPFKIVTIGSGALHYNVGLFLLASVLTRGGRFFLMAGLLRWHGERARIFIERRLALILTASMAMLALGVVMVIYL